MRTVRTQTAPTCLPCKRTMLQPGGHGCERGRGTEGRTSSRRQLARGRRRSVARGNGIASGFCDRCALAAKAEVVVLLRPAAYGWSAEDWRAYFDERAGIAEFEGGLTRVEAEARAFECCVCEWLNKNPAPSRPGRCVWCGQAGNEGATILPFGLEPSGHNWVHDGCWADWH